MEKQNQTKENSTPEICGANIKYMQLDSEGKERDKGAEEIYLKIMCKNFPKLMKDNKPQIQEV